MFDSGIFIILIIALIVGGIAIGAYMTKKRHERLAGFASQRGWKYHKKLNSMRRQVVVDVGGGRSGNAFHGVFEGELQGRPFYAGTAEWDETTGSGDDQTTKTYRRAIITRPISLNSPSMRLEKESFLTKIFNRDIKTEWEEFNKAWLIKGDDPRFVSAVLSPTMQQWLMHHQDYCYVLRPGWVSVYSPRDARLQYEDIDTLIAASTGFTEQILPFIWQDYGTRR